MRKTVKLIKKYLRKGQTIILESTSYPGTTREEIVEKIGNLLQVKIFLLAFHLKELIQELMKTK